MDYCSNCGVELRPAAKFCSNCGAPQTAAPAVAQAEEFELAGGAAVAPGGAADGVRPGEDSPPPAPPPTYADRPATPQKIENHLVKSIIATICCCVPFGIVGIVYAAQVDALLKQGNSAAAAEASEKAGMWSSLAIGMGLVSNLLLAVLTIYQFKLGGAY